MKRNFKVTEVNAGQRLDIFLTGLLNKNRSYVQKLFKEDLVSINDSAAKAPIKVRLNDKVHVDLPGNFKPGKLDLEVIYEDENVIVINKPAGVLTHSKGDYNPEATVATFIAPKISGMNGERAGIVHRLDRGTSGVIVCAKTAESLKNLQKQFSQRKAKKLYEAIIEGELKEPSAIIDMPIGRNPKKPQSFRVDPNGKPAVTKYETLKLFKHGAKSYSVVSLEPLTGRTHQIRVHLSHLGHPIVGDTVYGKKDQKARLMLHAKQLEITLPGGQRCVFSTKIPTEFKDFSHV